jgi:hypothetical protein
VGEQRGVTECSTRPALLRQRSANVFGEDDNALRYTTLFSATSTQLLSHRFELVHSRRLAPTTPSMEWQITGSERRVSHHFYWLVPNSHSTPVLPNRLVIHHDNPRRTSAATYNV